MMKSLLLAATVFVAGSAVSAVDAAPRSAAPSAPAVGAARRAASGEQEIRRFAERYLDESQVDAFVDFAQSALAASGLPHDENENGRNRILLLLLILAIATGAIP